jgi:signal transduction histidine kinase
MTSAVERLSLSQRFLCISFPILLTATILIGSWVGSQVHESVVQRIGADTALYVDGFIAPHLQQVETTGRLTRGEQDALTALMADAEWARRIVSLRIWQPDGTVLFSSDGKNIGQKLAIDEGLEAAAAGNISSEVSVRQGKARSDHGQPLDRMIETYTPIHTSDRGRIGAVAEFYQSTDEVDLEAGMAQRRSWGVVASAMLATYLLLFIVVRQGSRTILAQRAALSDQIALLTRLDVQNRELNGRVQRAAEDAIVLHESLLQRISASVHDGPCQDLGFALMQLKNLQDAQPTTAADSTARELRRVGSAVQSAMMDLRAIASDLELPDIEPLALDRVAARVVRDFREKTHHPASLETHVASDLQVHFRYKTTIYRLLQESLANSFRHAPGARCEVRLEANSRQISISIHDDGPGFDVEEARLRSRLGLRGMSQRVESLGGFFEASSRPGHGTSIHATLPLTQKELADA